MSYWTPGRRRFHTLGQFGRMTVQQAREAALDVFLRVRRGEDPPAHLRLRRQAPKVADLADRLLILTGCRLSTANLESLHYPRYTSRPTPTLDTGARSRMSNRSRGIF